VTEQGQDVDALISQLSARPGTKILKKFSTDLFAGVSVEVTQDNLDSLRALSTVANAWQSNTVQLANNTPIATFEEGVTVANYSVHASTGVDKLHAKGITGAGATVAVIDTGVWYTHPALGGGFGPGFKVAGGYDLVGDQGESDCPASTDVLC
jgi:subtilisin family serine protease